MVPMLRVWENTAGPGLAPPLTFKNTVSRVADAASFGIIPHWGNPSPLVAGIPLRAIQQEFHIRIPEIPGIPVYDFHAVPRGNILRSDMCISDNRINAVRVQDCKGVFPAGNSRFRGISFFPEPFLKQISDFQKRFFFPGLQCQATLTDHFLCLFQHNRPQTEAVVFISFQMSV